MKFLSYIESSGEQYIDTGYTPGSSNFSVVMSIKTVAASDAENWFVTINTAKPNGNAQFAQFGTYSSKFVIHLTGITADGVAVSTDNANITFAVSGNTASLSGDAEYSVTNARFGNGTYRNYPITVCGGMWRCYSCQIYSDGVLTRDFVPAMGDNGEIGLYDKLSGVLYTNSGTGNFIPGEALTEMYTATFTGLTNGNTYYARVYPMNAKGFAQSEIGTQIGSAIPG